MPAARSVEGVLPVFQTPFQPDEEIDVQSLETELDWIFEQGSDGIVMALVSEIFRLSSDERDRLTTIACKVCDDRGAVVISVGFESIHVARRHARHAQEAGADAVMAIPPVTIELEEEELLRYFSSLIQAVEVPVIVQDASSYVGKTLSPGLQRRLWEEFGDRAMFKPEANPIGPRLSQLREATRGRARVFEGSGGLHLIDSFRRGIVGTMPGAEVCWAIVALWKALQAGDDTSAYRIGGPLGLLVSLQTGLDGFIVLEKHILHRQGVIESPNVRGPIAFALDRETADEIDRLLDVLREAVETSGKRS